MLDQSVSSNYLPTPFFHSAKNRRIPEFRVRHAFLTRIARLNFDDRTIKIKLDVLSCLALTLECSCADLEHLGKVGTFLIELLVDCSDIRNFSDRYSSRNLFIADGAWLRLWIMLLKSFLHDHSESISFDGFDVGFLGFWECQNKHVSI